MFMSPEFMFISLIGMAIVFIPQMIVMSTYKKFAKVAVATGMSGADVANSILANAGVNNVQVVPIEGELSDHYDPSKKVIRLSQDIYYGKTVSALGIAAHEVGHAIQDSQGYMPMRIRAGIFPIVQAGQMIGPLLLMAGLGLRVGLGMGEFTTTIALIGIALYASVVAFHLITLPVEFNASYRAVSALANGGYVVNNQELDGTKKVLYAAALTYVAAALYALIELLYWVWMFFGRNNRD